MRSNDYIKRLLLKPFCLGLIACALLSTGCQWVNTRYQSLRGDGFKDQGSTSLRGDTADAKPSGFFTDKRSDQIEQNLGGF